MAWPARVQRLFLGGGGAVSGALLPWTRGPFVIPFPHDQAWAVLYFSQTTDPFSPYCGGGAQAAFSFRTAADTR